MPILRKWGVSVVTASPYDAPETGSMVLAGIVEGHPEERLNGEFITTSCIDHIEFDEIVTKSGRRYRLEGPPDPVYLEVLKSSPAKEGHEFGAFIRKAAGL
jgi:hypothetical protein